MNVLNRLVATTLMAIAAGISTTAIAAGPTPPKARNVMPVHGDDADGAR